MLRILTFLFALIQLNACATPDHAYSGVAKERAPSIQSRTIVLIHGMFLTPTSWAKWKTDFERAGYKVYAPAWPLHDQSPEVMRRQHPDTNLGKLELKDIVEQYRAFIKSLDEKPILIGHSMGGLIVQLLLQEKLAVAGVAIDSAPPEGLISMKFSFLRSNWAVISPFNDVHDPYLPDEDAFHYAFSNCVSEEEGRKIYREFATPESRLVGQAPTTEDAAIDFTAKTAPLLFIGGEEDHIIPASLNYANFRRYKESASVTEFKMFPGRCHWIVGQDGWEEVTQYIKQWLK